MRLHLPILFAISAITITSAAPSIRKRDADMESLQGLTHLKNDHSGGEGDPPEKYFHESTFHPHYDGRFGSLILPLKTRQPALKALVRTYLSTMHSLGVDTWIMHGSLLAWWWNRKIMPWDSDIDVQINESSMGYLANYHNMTVHRFKNIPVGFEMGEDGEEGEVKTEDRAYLLEINPHYINPSTDDSLNVIDARWIDTTTGLFIDITTIHPNLTAEKLGLDGHMMCKDAHSFHWSQIFPLRDSTFEDVPVRIPFAYAELLEQEYGPEALTETNFARHYFDQDKKEWIPYPAQRLLVDGKKAKDALQRAHKLRKGKFFQFDTDDGS